MRTAEPPQTRLRLLVLRTKQLERLRAFYRSLGVSFAAERHGHGPLHYAGNLGGVVLELYPLPQDGTSEDGQTRLGFSVFNLAPTLQTLEGLGTVVISAARETEWGLRAVVQDPDGRAVELYQG
jgi:hypothetical protein